MTYEYTDKVIKAINRYSIEKFGNLRSKLSIDELNSLENMQKVSSGVSKNVQKVYADAWIFVRKVYIALANYVYKGDFGGKELTRLLDEVWLDETLQEYDPVVKYVFNNEVERKEARLFEAIMGSTNPGAEIDAALRSWVLMTSEFAVRVADNAHLQALKDLGVDRVKWVSEKDNKVCRVCYKRDGKIYPLFAIPPKPHMNCRCHVERVK